MLKRHLTIHNGFAIRELAELNNHSYVVKISYLHTVFILLFAESAEKLWWFRRNHKQHQSH